MTRQVLINGDRELTGAHFQPVYPTLPFAAAERKKKRDRAWLGLAGGKYPTKTIKRTSSKPLPTCSRLAVGLELLGPASNDNGATMRVSQPPSQPAYRRNTLGKQMYKWPGIEGLEIVEMGEARRQSEFLSFFWKMVDVVVRLPPAHRLCVLP